MSETISQLPAGTGGFLSDVIPLTQGSTGPSTGTSRKLTTGQLLSSTGILYAGDPQYAGGVLANNTTDDTAAWAAVFSVAQSTGALVVAPLGVSKVSAITVPSNVVVVGRNTEPYGVSASGELSYTAGIGSTTLGSVIQANSSSTPVTLSAYSQLRDIQVIGTGAQSCVNGAAGRVHVENCDISNGTAGVEFSTSVAGGSAVVNCRINTMTGNGIDLPVNCMIIGNIINNCQRGVALSNGCNGNLIVNNRVAFCSLSNFSVNAASGNVAERNTFVGNYSDRAGNNGFFLSFASFSTVTGNTVYRSGRNQSGSPGNLADAHFNLTSCTGVVVANNTTEVWGDDSPNPIGYNSPFYAVYDGGSNTNCIISSNVLCYHNNSSGSTTGPINVTTTFNLSSSQNVTLYQTGRTV